MRWRWINEESIFIFGGNVPLKFSDIHDYLIYVTIYEENYG